MQHTPLKIKAVAADETHCWLDFDEVLGSKGVERMLGVYLTLDSVNMHICSFQASIEAAFAENVPIFYPDWRAVDGRSLPQVEEIDREEAMEYIEGAINEEQWTYFNRGSKFYREEEFDSPRAQELFDHLVEEGEDPYDRDNRVALMFEALLDYSEAPVY